jgi:plasmid stabilization system protein ParE
MKLVWTRQFQSDLDEAIEFLALKSPRAAMRVIDGLGRTLRGVAAHPQSGRVYRQGGDDSIRVILSGKFRVWYRVDASSGSIQLLHFRHGARLSPWEAPPSDDE